ncbi:short-chain dehydrogenase/reductase family protein [Achlya hypogyna]|uniref:Short-chain dehydrogenase/reductase family protein n=1 Tax=Achlya hypogyna TaxID=1202772 RepID=A0A1V9YJR6_ACHHY|nr:short-chain dehydrogenase/reductase family protein [Achlya hypogyna]
MGNSASAPPTSAEAFGPTTTAEQVADVFAAEAPGKVVLITGANTGLGLETARVLSAKGASVVIACRSTDKGEAAVASIVQAHPEAKVSFLQLDLASLASIRSFAAAFSANYERLDILINNAGVMACPKSTTTDGLETQFGVNHVGHFYLTKLLLPALLWTGKAGTPARVVNLSSMAQYIYAPDEGIRFDDLGGDKSYYEWERYGQAKLANVLFSTELNRRYQDQHVISIALHPGAILSTELSRYMGISATVRGISSLRSGMFTRVVREPMKSIPQGAATTLVAALRPDIVPGGYYADGQVSTELHPRALDLDIAKKLWEVTETIVNEIEAKLP